MKLAGLALALLLALSMVSAMSLSVDQNSGLEERGHGREQEERERGEHQRELDNRRESDDQRESGERERERERERECRAITDWEGQHEQEERERERERRQVMDREVQREREERERRDRDDSRESERERERRDRERRRGDGAVQGGESERERERERPEREWERRRRDGYAEDRREGQEERERRERDEREKERREGRRDGEVKGRREGREESERREREERGRERREREPRHTDSETERESREREERERRDLDTRRGESERERERERHHGRRGERESRRDLQLGEPRQRFQSEGGKLRVWEEVHALRDADVRVQTARITIHQRGLVLPKYSDSETLAYVEDGEGLMGLLTGYSLGESARRVKRGDVIAIPRGFSHWWYNSGKDDLHIIAVADTSRGLYPGEYTVFPLIGGQRERGAGDRAVEQEQEQLRGVLHGFKKEFLAEAWDVEDSQVEELLSSQQGVGIVRVENDVDIESIVGVKLGNGQIASLSEYAYNVREGTPEVRVQHAGHFTAVNSFKMSVLKSLNLGLTYGLLEKNAIFAPHWSPTGHQIVHILRGSAWLQIAGNNGDEILSKEMMQGDVFVIPRFYPAGVQAGNEGLEWISFHTTDMPYVEALAGKTSVLRQLPEQVAAAAFNMDIESVRQCREKRLSEALLLPPRGRYGMSHHDETFEGSYLRFLKGA